MRGGNPLCYELRALGTLNAGRGPRAGRARRREATHEAYPNSSVRKGAARPGGFEPLTYGSGASKTRLGDTRGAYKLERRATTAMVPEIAVHQLRAQTNDAIAKASRVAVTAVSAARQRT